MDAPALSNTLPTHPSAIDAWLRRLYEFASQVGASCFGIALREDGCGVMNSIVLEGRKGCQV